MRSRNEITVVVDQGVLRPETRIDMPDGTRLVIMIRSVETTPEADAVAREKLHELRRRGTVRLGGWHPTREEMHERD
jgi:predicted DNA-binding antitoxin AbrB/MazE fold protein